MELRDIPKSHDEIPPELEKPKDQATILQREEQAKEPEMEQKTRQQEPAPGSQPQRGEDTPTTTQPTPKEVV